MKTMIRNRQKKSTIGMFTDESVKEALVMVINGGVSIRGVVIVLILKSKIANYHNCAYAAYKTQHYNL